MKASGLGRSVGRGAEQTTLWTRAGVGTLRALHQDRPSWGKAGPAGRDCALLL